MLKLSAHLIKSEYMSESKDSNTSKYIEKFSDNIWFTRKARVQSSERLKNDHTHTQLLLVEYTLIGAVLSVIVIRHNKLFGSDTDIMLAIMSIVILVLSLVITNFNMKERSNIFFNNYVQLQLIYLESKEIEKIENSDMSDVREKYKKALLDVENHTVMDDICARVENAKSLYSRHPTCVEYFKCFGYKTIKFIMYLLLYSAPILLGYLFCIGTL